MNDTLTREPARGLDLSKLVLGLFLVALGLAFLFDRLYWWNVGSLFRLWPLWLIGFGVLRVLLPGRRRSRLAGLWPIVVGGIFLMDTLDVMPIQDSWPLFIVVAGLLMALRAAGLAQHGQGCTRHDEGSRS